MKKLEKLKKKHLDDFKANEVKASHKIIGGNGYTGNAGGQQTDQFTGGGSDTQSWYWTQHGSGVAYKDYYNL
jgi:hypothetical protein